MKNSLFLLLVALGTEVNFRLLRSPSHVYQGKCPCDHVQCSCSVYFQVCELDGESRRRRGECMKWKSLYSALSLSLSLPLTRPVCLYSWKVWRRPPNEGLAALRKREEGERDSSDTALPGSSSRPDRPTDRARWSVDQIALQSSVRRRVGRSALARSARGGEATSLKFLFNPLTTCPAR